MTHPIQTVSTETALRILAEPERRSVLARLIDSEDNVVTRDELVEYVSLENPPPEQPGAICTERLLLRLDHTHLPKLEETGFIEWDKRTKTVRYRPNERVEKLHQFVTAEFER